MMMNRILLKTVFLIAVMAASFSISWAQLCVPDVPESLYVGNSYCIKVCAFELYAFQLVGTIQGPQGKPIMFMEPGCNRLNECYDPSCSPIDPPPNLDSLIDDTLWHGETECLQIDMDWVHHQYWLIQIFAWCDGCFCIRFDHQLPVELKSFGALAGDNEVTLTWQTASENNNRGFQILRDGERIHWEDSQGNSPTGYSYSWTDQDVLNTHTYTYTLVAEDMAGNVRELATTSATPVFTTPGVVHEWALHQNYPNPFNPNTRISFDLLEGGLVTLKVYSPTGAEIASLVNGYVGPGLHAIEFDGSKLTSGLYFYSIKVGEKFSATRKMLLVK